MSKYTDDEYRSFAKGKYQIDGMMGVDSAARLWTNPINPNGAFVQAWIWVSDAEIEKAQAKEQPE